MVRDEIRDRVSLYILREVVKEAKKQRINLSQITEEWLKVHTLIGKNDGSLHDAYSHLLKSILPILSKFDCSVIIANGKEMVPSFDDKGNEYEIKRSLNILLTPDGSFYIDEYDRYFQKISMIAPEDFLDPERILKNLVDTLVKNKEVNRKKMREILMAKNIVDAIYKSLVETSSTTLNDKPIQNRKITQETKEKKYRRKKYRKATSEEPNKKPKKLVHGN